MRVLQAPTNVANQAWSAAQGLRALGHDAEVWHFGANPFSFPADRLIEDAADPATIVRVLQEALDGGFDVFHFHFARSLVPARDSLPWFWDLPLLRALDKRIVFTFHGTDVRLRSKHLVEDPWSYYRFADVACDEETITSRLNVIRGYADHLIVASPLNRTFVPEAFYIPKIIDLGPLQPAGPSRRKDPLVVHVPSRRSTKGTEFVLRGIKQLEERGLSFQFRLAESLPHDEMLGLLADADVVVDNLLLGDCEVSALEAMALAKPVVTRVRDEVLDEHPDLPAVRADPDSFVSQMEQLLGDASSRAELGERGRLYVASNHASEIVAQRLLALYERPGKGTRITFPGWTQPPRAERIVRLEERVQTLEARAGKQQRRTERDLRTVEVLKRRIAALEALPEFRAGKVVRRAIGRARRLRPRP